MQRACIHLYCYQANNSLEISDSKHSNCDVGIFKDNEVQLVYSVRGGVSSQIQSDLPDLDFILNVTSAASSSSVKSKW